MEKPGLWWDTTWTLRDEEHTERAGQLLARAFQPGDIVGLMGDLGAGKTCITRGIFAGLCQRAGTTPDPEQRITSPTYTLVNEYEGSGDFPRVLHFDLYRLTDFDDLESTGYWDMLEGADLALVEWMDQVEDAWPQGGWQIWIEHQEEGRTLHLGWSKEEPGARERLQNAAMIFAEHL